MRLSLVVLLALAACEGSTPPKESSTINNDDTAKTDDTAQTNDTGGTDTDTTPTFLMILVADDVASESILWTSGIFDLTINSDGEVARLPMLNNGMIILLFVRGFGL